MALMARRCGARAVVTVAAALALAVPAVAQRAPAQTGRRTGAVGLDLSEVLEATTALVSPGVVEIHTTAFVAADGSSPQPTDLVTTERGSGSGVIVDPTGYIVTNAHVVRGAQRLRVEVPRPASGLSVLSARAMSVPAELVGLDLETDLAVLKVALTGLPTVGFGDSDVVRAGQLVLAFGSPLGLRNTVSMGIVSAVARQLEPDAPMIYLQTDAPINAGSSGGPLVDLQGRLVGINTLIASRTGGYEGLGFAAPVNIVRTVYEQIRAHGRVRRGDIGVRAQTITTELASGLGLSRDSGVLVADVVPRSPAAIAGVRPGDIVLSLDGRPMENARQLRVGLYRRFVGDVVTLTVEREGQADDYPVAMTERPDPMAGLSAQADPREHLLPRLGVLGVTLDRRVATLLPSVRGAQGVVVLSTVGVPGGTREGGLAPGDVIYALNRTPVESLSTLRTALDAVTPGTPVVLQLERRGELQFLTLVIE